MSTAKPTSWVQWQCFDPRHASPCPLPCFACEEECDPTNARKALVFSDWQPPRHARKAAASGQATLLPILAGLALAGLSLLAIGWAGDHVGAACRGLAAVARATAAVLEGG